MEPLSWVNQYPAGLMIVDKNGNVTVPSATSHQTTTQTAHKRGIDLINTGSTHKLPPIHFETFSNKQNTKEQHYYIFIITIIIFLIILWGLGVL